MAIGLDGFDLGNGNTKVNSKDSLNDDEAQQHHDDLSQQTRLSRCEKRFSFSFTNQVLRPQIKLN